jgi:hypothetical protein
MKKMFNRATVTTVLENANIVTHANPHHAGEVFAIAMLSLLKRVRVLRTNDKALIQCVKKDGPKGLIMVDVGGEFNPNRRIFDHHQESFEEHYSDYMKLSVAGLVWRHYSMMILSKFDCPLPLIVEATLEVSHDLVHGVDAKDHGYGSNSIEMSISDAVDLFNPNWDDPEQDPDEAFLQAVSLAQRILEKEIKKVVSIVRAKSEIENMIAHNDNELLYLPMHIGGWEEYILKSFNPKAKKLLYCVYPDPEGGWKIQAISVSRDNLTQKRKTLPSKWCGLSGVQFTDLTGVETAFSCRADGTAATAKTLDGALRLAQMAISQ